MTKIKQTITKRLAILSIILLMAPAAASADMLLTISELGNDVLFELTGSIDTSVFALGPGNASGAGASFFSYFDSGVSTTGTVESARIRSGSVPGDNYFFADDVSLTPFGVIPGSGAVTLSGDPLFWYGFNDHTPTPGITGNFEDVVILPDGYVSGTTINLSYIEPNTTLADLGLVNGDFWGVDFTDGMGGTQSAGFQVCLLYTSPSPRDQRGSRMPSSA